MGFFIDLHIYKIPTANQITVACVGDSITYGYGVTGWLTNSYPQKLNKYLGPDYCVNNYGYSCRTASFSADLPYTKTDVYEQSKIFLPDIVIIMLGTNDAKSKNWISEESFYDDFNEIVKSYQQLESTPEIILACPIPVISVKNEDPDNELLEAEVRNVVKQIASEQNLQCVDFYEIFENKNYLYRDGIHPNASGAEIIAKILYEIVK